MSNCNCIEHYCAGYEAGKSIKARPVVRLTHREVENISIHQKDVRYEGTYAVEIYHKPDIKVFNSQRTWMLGVEILTSLCGVNVSRLTFQPDPSVTTYEYGLVED